MPGLFGCISIDPAKRLTDACLEPIWSRMVERLSHATDYATDRRLDPRGRWAVGRIGHLSHMPDDVPGEDPAGTERTVFYGVMRGTPPPSTTPPMSGIGLRRGNFSAVNISDDGARLALVADTRASEPVYFTEYEGILYFAPEVKALLGHGFTSGGLDPGALAGHLGSGYLLPHQTLFGNIRKLRSGHALVVEGGRCREVEYWRYEPGSDAGAVDRRELPLRLAELVSKSVSADFGSPDDTMMFLSGGLDSRYLLACVARAARCPAETVQAITWAERPDVPGQDPEIAKIVAHHLGVRHRFVRRSIEEYENWFKEANCILDGQSEIAAFHPHEFQIMKELKARGITRVVRGDEAFGLRGHVYTAEAALANIEIRPFRGISLLSSVMTPDWYARTCEAGQAEYDSLLERGRGIHPVDYKDICYLTLRVPTLLGSASYLKQVLFDHRNPLLDNDIFDLYRTVPIDLRLDKKLFYQAFSLAHPDLARIPYATSPGTEDWDSLIARDTPLQRMIHKEIGDVGSGIWEIFDRKSVAELFRNAAPASSPAGTAGWKGPARAVRDGVARIFPRQVGKLSTRRAQAKMRVSQLIMRIMTLKHWHDTFVAER